MSIFKQKRYWICPCPYFKNADRELVITSIFHEWTWVFHISSRNLHHRRFPFEKTCFFPWRRFQALARVAKMEDEVPSSGQKWWQFWLHLVHAPVGGAKELRRVSQRDGHRFIEDSSIFQHPIVVNYICWLYVISPVIDQRLNQLLLSFLASFG
jgi:hypothetical protein